MGDSLSFLGFPRTEAGKLRMLSRRIVETFDLFERAGKWKIFADAVNSRSGTSGSAVRAVRAVRAIRSTRALKAPEWPSITIEDGLLADDARVGARVQSSAHAALTGVTRPAPVVDSHAHLAHFRVERWPASAH